MMSIRHAGETAIVGVPSVPRSERTEELVHIGAVVDLDSVGLELGGIFRLLFVQFERLLKSYNRESDASRSGSVASTG